MTTSLASRGDRTSVPTFSRLFVTELIRLWSRRFTRVLLGLSVIGYLVAVVFLWQAHAQETPADIAQATSQRDQAIVDMTAGRADCLKTPGNTEEACGPVPTPDQFPVDQFLSNNPFRPNMVQDYTIAVGAAVAMAGFILAATSIGAEWSSKNIVAWLFYEPRRLRLMGAKMLSLTLVVVVLSAVAQVVWALTARLLLSQRGLPVSTLGPEASHFWSDIFGMQVRAGLLVVPVALIGFGLANLIKNTAAALGIAFVFIAVVESVMRAVTPAWQPYQFTTSAVAWMQHGGVTVYGADVYNQQYGGLMPKAIHISNASGGLTLLVYAVIVLVISLGLFKRRDVA